MFSAKEEKLPLVLHNYMIDQIKKYRIEISLFLLTLSVALSVFLWSGLRFPNDDQFILFRYIDNIVFGKGFVYNEGEKVLGATTPLFTLIVASLKYIFSFIDTPNLLAYINIVFLGVSSIFFYKIARRFISENFSILVTLIFAFNMSKTIPEGMETPLFLLTNLAFIHYLLKEKYYISSIFLGLSILTRPDAGLIAVMALVFWWQKVGFEKTVRLVLTTVVVCLPWLIFATVYFGSFIPQSLLTKTHSHDIYNLPLLQATKIQAAHLSRIFWGKIFDPNQIPLQVLLNLIPFLLLFIIGMLKKITRNTWIIFVIPIVYFLSFSISNPIIFPWYLSQMEPFWILISLIGFACIYEKIKSHFLRTILLILILSGPIFFWLGMVTSEDRGSKTSAFLVGGYIKDNMSPEDTIGLADIGIVGYVSGAKIIDFIGLVNSDSVSYYPVKAGCFDKNELYIIPPELIKEKKPVWLVAGLNSLDRCFIESDWFSKNYNIVDDLQYGAKVWRLNNNKN